MQRGKRNSKKKSKIATIHILLKLANMLKAPYDSKKKIKNYHDSYSMDNLNVENFLLSSRTSPKKKEKLKHPNITNNLHLFLDLVGPRNNVSTQVPA